MSKKEKLISDFEKASKALVNFFTKKEPKEFNYTDIDSFEDAYDMVEDSQTVIGDNLIDQYRKIISLFPKESYYNALAKMRIVIFAGNGCDESFPDWKNSNQEKRFPWFEMEKTGVGFLFLGSCYDGTDACVGSRLVFKDLARDKYFAEHKNFKCLYKIIFNQ